MRQLAKFDRGEDVRNLQKLLNIHLSEGYERLDPDGDFGSRTDARVREFQTLNDLDPDGIVGYFTREKLLDLREVQMYLTAVPRHYEISSRRGPATRGFAQRGLAAMTAGPAVLPVAARTAALPAMGIPSAALTSSPTIGQVGQQPGPPMKRQVQVLSGHQFSINPWFFSPIVITGQVNWLATNNGRPDFVLTVGAQVAVNDMTGPAGAWTVQGFAQMGLSGLLKKGNFDLANPFVVMMLQNSEKPKPLSFGLGVGNQMNYILTKNGALTLFLNKQVVTNVDLGSGQGSAPGLQIVGGVGYQFDWP